MSSSIKNNQGAGTPGAMATDMAIPLTAAATHLHFIIAGGTIDSVDLDSGTANTESKIVPYIINSVKTYFPMSAEVAFMKDSRDITYQDRQLLLDKIVTNPQSRFIITHGTFTLAETGRFLKSELQKVGQDKTVILVAAMIPMGEVGSDAPFNLGFAACAAMVLPKGVWIAMHGAAWDPDLVEKDSELLRFKQCN